MYQLLSLEQLFKLAVFYSTISQIKKENRTSKVFFTDFKLYFFSVESVIYLIYMWLKYSISAAVFQMLQFWIYLYYK